MNYDDASMFFCVLWKHERFVRFFDVSLVLPVGSSPSMARQTYHHIINHSTNAQHMREPFPLFPSCSFLQFLISSSSSVLKQNLHEKRTKLLAAYRDTAAHSLFSFNKFQGNAINRFQNCLESKLWLKVWIDKDFVGLKDLSNHRFHLEHCILLSCKLIVN